MPPHYVPAAYLGHFANPVAVSARKEKLFAVLRKTGEQRQIPVEHLAVKNGAYDEEDDQPAEQFFGRFESRLRGALSDVVYWSDRKDSQTRKTAGAELLTQAALIATRNLQHGTGDTFESKFEASQYWLTDIAMTHIIGAIPEVDTDAVDAIARVLGMSERLVRGELDNPERITSLIDQAIAKRWQWRVVHSPNGYRLLTSDNPAVWANVGDSGNIMLLPIGPSHLFIACTRDHRDFTSKRMAIDDVDHVNGIIARTAQNWVFSSVELDPQMLRLIRSTWAKSPQHRSTLNTDYWTGENFATVDVKNEVFSFLKALA